MLIESRLGLDGVGAQVAAVALEELTQLRNHALRQKILVDVDGARRRHIQFIKEATQHLLGRPNQRLLVDHLDMSRDMLEVWDERQMRTAAVQRAEQNAWMVHQAQVETCQLSGVLRIHWSGDGSFLICGLVGSRESVTGFKKMQKAMLAADR